MRKVGTGLPQTGVSKTTSGSPVGTTTPSATPPKPGAAAQSETTQQLPDQTKAKIKSDKQMSGVMKKAIFSGAFKSTGTPKAAPKKDMEQMLGMDPSKVTMEVKLKDDKSYQDLKAKFPPGDPHVQFNDKKRQIDISYPPAVAADKLPKAARSDMEALADAKLKKDGKYNDLSDAKQSTRFEEAFASSSYASTRSKQHETAKNQSKNFKYDEFDKKFSTGNRAQLKSDVEGKTSTGDVASHLLQNNDGFAISEKHKDPRTKEMLINNMPALKASGVDTIYVEHFRFGEHQKSLNDYMKSPKGTAMPKELSDFIDKNDQGNQLTGKSNLRGLVETARSNDVRIVAMDDAMAKAKLNENRTEKLPAWQRERAARMNSVAEDIIRNDTDRTGKYVILAGGAHNNTHEGGIPGMSQRMNIPAVKFSGDNGTQMTLDQEDAAKRKYVK